MLRVVLEITGNVDDARAVCEKLATDFEKYGDVRVVEVTETKPEQMKMEGFERRPIYGTDAGQRY